MMIFFHRTKNFNNRINSNKNKLNNNNIFMIIHRNRKLIIKKINKMMLQNFILIINKLKNKFSLKILIYRAKYRIKIKNRLLNKKILIC